MKKFLILLALSSTLGLSVQAKENIEVCFSPVESCDVKLISFMKSARQTLDVAVYSINHEEIVKTLIEMKKKGIKVRIVADNVQAHTTNSLVPMMEKVGLNLRIGKFKGIMHQKYTIVDGRAVQTGSFNYTTRAVTHNAENQVYIRETIIVNKFEKDFESIWENARDRSDDK